MRNVTANRHSVKDYEDDLDEDEDDLAFAMEMAFAEARSMEEPPPAAFDSQAYYRGQLAESSARHLEAIDGGIAEAPLFLVRGSLQTLDGMPSDMRDDRWSEAREKVQRRQRELLSARRPTIPSALRVLVARRAPRTRRVRRSRPRPQPASRDGDGPPPPLADARPIAIGGAS